MLNTNKFIPRFTPQEKKVYKVTNQVLDRFVALTTLLLYVIFGIYVFGFLTTIEGKEIISLFAPYFFSLASQCAMESKCWSKDAYIMLGQHSLRLMELNFTFLEVHVSEDEEGAASSAEEDDEEKALISKQRKAVERTALSCLFQILYVLDNVFPDPKYWVESTNDLPHVFAYNKTHRRRRLSIVQDTINKTVHNTEPTAMDKELDKKYNVLSADFGKLIPFVVGFGMACIPTIVGFARLGVDGTVFGGKLSGYDSFVDILMFLINWLLYLFIMLVLINGSKNDIREVNSLTRGMLLFLSPEHDLGEEDKLLGARTSGASSIPWVRIRTVREVEGISKLYKYVFSSVQWANARRLAIFQVLSGVGLLAAGGAFISSYLLLEIEE